MSLRCVQCKQESVNEGGSQCISCVSCDDAWCSSCATSTGTGITTCCECNDAYCKDCPLESACRKCSLLFCEACHPPECSECHNFICRKCQDSDDVSESSMDESSESSHAEDTDFGSVLHCFQCNSYYCSKCRTFERCGSEADALFCNECREETGATCKCCQNWFSDGVTETMQECTLCHGTIFCELCTEDM